MINNYSSLCDIGFPLPPPNWIYRCGCSYLLVFLVFERLLVLFTLMGADVMDEEHNYGTSYIVDLAK